MLIELRGVNFKNKGAELMLNAAVHKIRAELPDVILAMLPGSEKDYPKRAKLGLFQKVSSEGISKKQFREFAYNNLGGLLKNKWVLRWLQHKFRNEWGYMGYLIHPDIRRQYGLIIEDEVDVVMDASGYKYGDPWSAEATINMAALVKKWKSRGVKVILLPQAMGPFSSSQTREAFGFIALNADLVFPRDDRSYKHVTELTGKQNHIKQAPDFTNLLSGTVPEKFNLQNNRFCIIPNYRMIDKNPLHKSSEYIELLAACARYLAQRKKGPFLLIQEGGADDLMVAKEIIKQLENPIPIVEEEDPLKIKGIIGKCIGMFSSRYHGLICALSQGIPALGTGWSYKYEMLFKDYGFIEGFVSVQGDLKMLYDKIDFILDLQKSNRVRKNLVEAAEQLRSATENMWQNVFDCIQN